MYWCALRRINLSLFSLLANLTAFSSDLCLHLALFHSPLVCCFYSTQQNNNLSRMDGCGWWRERQRSCSLYICLRGRKHWKKMKDETPKKRPKWFFFFPAFKTRAVTSDWGCEDEETQLWFWGYSVQAYLSILYNYYTIILKRKKKYLSVR